MNERVMCEMKKILYEEVVPKLNKLELEINELKSKKDMAELKSKKDIAELKSKKPKK